MIAPATNWTDGSTRLNRSIVGNVPGEAHCGISNSADKAVICADGTVVDYASGFDFFTDVKLHAYSIPVGSADPSQPCSKPKALSPGSEL